MLEVIWTENPKYLGGDLSKESFRRFHEQWQKTVPEALPKDNFLIFDVKQGWEPLCKFLGKPIPEVPFPNMNDTKQMQGRFKVLNCVGYTIFISMLLIVALIAILIGLGVKGYLNQA